MAVIDSCPKHNMVAYLEKIDGNTEFHEIISFLMQSSIHYALTVSPIVSTTFVEQFWMSAKSKIINNVRYITAKIAGKPVSISEASIRSDLLFDDADGIDSGKHFLGNVTPLFDSMLVQPTEDEGDTLERQSEPQPIPSPPHLSPDQHKTQTDPFPRLSPTTHILDSILEGSSGNHEGQSFSDRSLSGNEGGMTLQSVYDICISLYTQERKHAKAEPIVHKDPAFDELDDDTIDYMETGDAQVSTDKPKDSTDKPDEGTDKPKGCTDKEEVSTDRPDEGTLDQNEGRSVTQTASITTTPTIFGDDETIAQVLIIMSQNKEKLKEK
ncbi:hypothetical protein Tco_0153205 [Tanacetum coccineum]